VGERIRMERVWFRQTRLTLELSCTCGERGYFFNSTVRDGRVKGIVDEARGWVDDCPACAKERSRG
jgi:hypothetical protein